MAAGGPKRSCDAVAGACVECLATGDCPPNNDCIARECVPIVTCHNSLDCTADAVCDTATGRCVTCVQDVDCPDGQRCGANTCHSACESDKDCTPQNLLCDASVGYCVACRASEDCKPLEFCALGQCEPDVCIAGSSHCSNDAVVVCDDIGSATLAPQPCGTTGRCDEGASGAACTFQVCFPDSVGCGPVNGLVTCSHDGFSWLPEQPCPSQTVCLNDTCQPVVCTVGQWFCTGEELRFCNEWGTGSDLQNTCSGRFHCDASANSCVFDVCEPSLPACNGNTLTTCNTLGDGYATGGTDCGAQSCSSGRCKDPLFVEDFEDGDLTGWTPGGTSTSGVVTTSAANGTAHSVEMSSTAGRYFDGLSRTFTNLHPTQISWWARPPVAEYTESVDFVIRFGATPGLYDVVLWARCTNLIPGTNAKFVCGLQLPAGGRSDFWIPLATWLHFEARNIDWTAKKFDFYINDTPMLLDTNFYSPSATGVDQLDLFNLSGTTSGFDQITFL